MNRNKIIILVVAVLIVSAGSFYGGVLYEKNTGQRSFNFDRNQMGNLPSNTNGSMRMEGMGANSGEIISKDDTSITLKLADGGSKIIFFSETTEISKNTAGNLEDLEVGKNIVVQGTENSDGSITAQSIQIRPKN